MTASFHKYGEYFPGSGHYLDVGTGKGRNYSINFPLKDGMDDDSYREYVFKPVIGASSLSPLTCYTEALVFCAVDRACDSASYLL